MKKFLLLSIFTFLYIYFFIYGELILSVEPRYGYFSNIGAVIPVLFWFAPVGYRLVKNNLSIKIIIALVGINAVLVCSFIAITNTNWALEIRNRGEENNINNLDKNQKMIDNIFLLSYTNELDKLVILGIYSSENNVNNEIAKRIASNEFQNKANTFKIDNFLLDDGMHEKFGDTGKYFILQYNDGGMSTVKNIGIYSHQTIAKDKIQLYITENPSADIKYLVLEQMQMDKTD